MEKSNNGVDHILDFWSKAPTKYCFCKNIRIFPTLNFCGFHFVFHY